MRFLAKYFLFLVAVFANVFLNVCSSAEQSVPDALKENGVVPDIIDVAPTELIHVMYGNLKVTLGNELTPTEVKNIPTVHWNAKDGAYYLLSMTDPDAPSRANPEEREAQHWLVGNIPGDKVDEGKTLTAYIGSGPGNGTGLHRYIFLVYQQPEKIEFEEKFICNRTLGARLKFITKKFAEKYNLGNPIAGNFYQAQYDDYVPQLHHQLMIN